MVRHFVLSFVTTVVADQVALRSTKQCLDLPGGDLTPGNVLWMWDCKGSDDKGQASQRWVFTLKQLKYGSMLDDLCVDVSGDHMSDGSPLQLWNCVGAPQQQWEFDEDQGKIWLSHSTYADANKCMEVGDGFPNLGAPMQLGTCSGADTQVFDLVPSAAPTPPPPPPPTPPPVPPPPTPPAPCVSTYTAGDYTVDIAPVGAPRRFRILVPEGVDINSGLPAVIGLHDAGSNPYHYWANFGADMNQYPWIHALPFATAEKESPLCCPEGTSDDDCKSGEITDETNPCTFKTSADSEDVGFIEAVTDYLKEYLCVNPDAVFVTGSQNGGTMANRIGCDLSDSFKGIAAYSGEIAGDCSPEMPISVVEFCEECSETTTKWVDANSCTGSDQAEGCTTYSKCEGGVSVQQCGNDSDNDYMIHFSNMLAAGTMSV